MQPQLHQRKQNLKHKNNNNNRSVKAAEDSTARKGRRSSLSDFKSVSTLAFANVKEASGPCRRKLFRRSCNRVNRATGDSLSSQRFCLRTHSLGKEVTVHRPLLCLRIRSRDNPVMVPRPHPSPRSNRRGRQVMVHHRPFLPNNRRDKAVTAHNKCPCQHISNRDKQVMAPRVSSQWCRHINNTIPKYSSRASAATT